jgi:molybdopterin synthase catalytic subunit
MISIRESAFDPYAELVHYQNEMLNQAGKYGATSVFVGTMRDFNEGDSVRALWLEHYPGMTEAELSRIVDETRGRWPFLASLVIHRVGRVLPNETIVLVAVWSAHRAAALNATQEIIEALKHRAPFWKKESLAASERWVEHNTPG